ncbi:MAG: transposase [Ideonella sp.]|nr:transposase [Ideonella sp.]
MLKLKTPWRKGTTHLAMSPLEFMQRLAALVPGPRLHLTAPMACWHPTPSCAPMQCRKSPSHRRRPHRPSSARRSARTAAQRG